MAKIYKSGEKKNRPGVYQRVSDRGGPENASQTGTDGESGTGGTGNNNAVLGQAVLGQMVLGQKSL